MIISKDLIEMGIDESIIILLHSKTKLKHREIESAELVISSDNKLLVRLSLLNPNMRGNRSRKAVINIDKNRIRDLKLKMIFNS